jgi:hypothetical protein
MIVDYPGLGFTIRQGAPCPALMVPVPIFDPGWVGMQSPMKLGGSNPATGVSVTVKEPDEWVYP